MVWYSYVPSYSHMYEIIYLYIHTTNANGKLSIIFSLLYESDTCFGSNAFYNTCTFNTCQEQNK